MAKSIDFEKEIIKRGAIKIEEFTSHAGSSANYKLELDEKFLKADEEFANQIVENLAGQLEVFEPKLIVPIPNGANYLGRLVARHMGVSMLELKHPERHIYKFGSTQDRKCVLRASTIGFVDDVFTTGSSLREVSSLEEFDGRVAAAGVIWDRSDSGKPKKLDFALRSVVERYLPLRVETN